MTYLDWEDLGILPLLEKYFSDKAYDFIIQELNRIDLPDKGVYSQISQKDEKTELEIVYMSEKVLFYYKFSGLRKELILLPLRSISEITIMETKLYTRINITGLQRSLTFRAGIRSKTRQYLKEFCETIQALMEFEG